LTAAARVAVPPPQVDRLGGMVAQSEGQAGVTHVVCPFGPGGDPDDGQHYMRNMGSVWVAGAPGSAAGELLGGEGGRKREEP
jgi:hypothetical protein